MPAITNVLGLTRLRRRRPSRPYTQANQSIALLHTPYRLAHPLLVADLEPLG